MKKFTCIAEYKGGTYISQYLAEDVFEAERIWANNLHPRYFKPREKKKIIEQTTRILIIVTRILVV